MSVFTEAVKKYISTSIARKGLGSSGSEFRDRVDQCVRYYFSTLKPGITYPRPISLKEYIRNEVAKVVNAQAKVKTQEPDKPSNTTAALPSTGEIKIIGLYPPIGKIGDRTVKFANSMPVKPGKTYRYSLVNNKIVVKGEFEGIIGRSQRQIIGGKTLVLRQGDLTNLCADSVSFDPAVGMFQVAKTDSPNVSELAFYDTGNRAYMSGTDYIEGSYTVDLSEHINSSQRVVKIMSYGDKRLLITVEIIPNTDRYSCAFELVILRPSTGDSVKLAHSRSAWSNIGDHGLFFGYLDVIKNAQGRLVLLSTGDTPSNQTMPIKWFDNTVQVQGSCTIHGASIHVKPFNINDDLTLEFGETIFYHDGLLSSKHGINVYGGYEQCIINIHPVTGELYLYRYFRIAKQDSGSTLQDSYVYGAAGFEVWNATQGTSGIIQMARGGGVYRSLTVPVPQHGPLPWCEMGYPDERLFYVKFLPSMATMNMSGVGSLDMLDSSVDSFFGWPLVKDHSFGWNDLSGVVWVDSNKDYPDMSGFSLNPRQLFILRDLVTEEDYYVTYCMVPHYQSSDGISYSFWEESGYQLIGGSGFLYNLNALCEQDNVKYMARPAANPADFIHHWNRCNSEAVQLTPDILIIKACTHAAEQYMEHTQQGYTAQGTPSVWYTESTMAFIVSDGLIDNRYESYARSSMPLIQAAIID